MNTETIICWGHNPGQRYVKDSLSLPNGKRKDVAPYPAVIAPWAKSDDTGLTRKTKDLTATVNGRQYIGGQVAERMSLATRQMASGRLDADSPLYQAFAQMSAQHLGLIGKRNEPAPKVLIASALPVGWRDEAAEEALKKHLKDGLNGLVEIKGIYVQSEPNAVVSYELIDDSGNIRTDQARLAKGVVCVGDIGGGTLNHSVLEGLRALPGESASPLLGSSEVVEKLARATGAQYIDAERRIIRALQSPGTDSAADHALNEYREAVVGTLQQVWRRFRPDAYLFAGGTVHWVADALKKAFPTARIIENPQQVIAIGLYRYARRKALRGA